MLDQKVKTVTATVISNSGSKSIRVAVDFKVKHPKYGKYMKRRTTYSVHDEHNVANVGDIVEISQCRPYSKMKSWRLVKVVKEVVKE